jgi:hypothetical protein
MAIGQGKRVRNITARDGLEEEPPLPATDRVQLLGGHRLGMPLKPFLADLKNAGATVGAEDQAKDLGDEIIELPAIAGFGNGRTIGASGIVVFSATSPHLTPRGLRVGMTSRATLPAVGPASAAIEAAVGDEFRVGNNWFHRIS